MKGLDRGFTLVSAVLGPNFRKTHPASLPPTSAGSKVSASHSLFWCRQLYLVMLDRLGRPTEADRIVRRLTESWFQWDKDPVAYEKARTEIAAMIVAANPTSRRTAPAASSEALHPWSTNTHPTDVAKSHVEEIADGVGTTHKYTVFQGGTMDGRNCRLPMGCGIAREGALLQTWESNRSVRMENVGDADVVNPWLSNGRNNFRSVEEIVSSAVAPGMTDADKAFALWFQEI